MRLQQHLNHASGDTQVPINLENTTRPTTIPQVGKRIGGNFSASPILVDGRIYLFDENGRGTVIAAERTFKVISSNELEAGCMGSPAVAGDLLIVRTKKALYGIRTR